MDCRAYQRVCPVEGVTDLRRPESADALLTSFTASVHQTWNKACHTYSGITIKKVKGKACQEPGRAMCFAAA